MFDLYQLITVNTRHANFSLTDHVYTTAYAYICISENIVAYLHVSISDHSPLCVTRKDCSTASENDRITVLYLNQRVFLFL